MLKLNKWLLLLALLVPMNSFSSRLLIDSELISYFQEFAEIHRRVCGEPISTIMKKPITPVVFADVKKMCQSADAVGCCYPSEQVVMIDKKFFERSEDMDRRSVIFHELTHCIYHAPHTSSEQHFMYPSVTLIRKADIYVQVAQYAKKNCGKPKNDN